MDGRLARYELDSIPRHELNFAHQVVSLNQKMRTALAEWQDTYVTAQ